MESINVGILGWSGFLGARLSNDLKYKFKIKKINKLFKTTRYQNLNTIICCKEVQINFGVSEINYPSRTKLKTFKKHY